MPYALGAINVQGGQTYTVSVGSAGTVGAVVIANESPYSVQASAGAGGQWIVAQTADLVACNVSGFNGTLTLTTDNYLSNATSAPSFLLYLTAYAPGEAIRGTFPAPLMRLSNGGNVGIASSLVSDSSPSGTQIIEARPAAAAGPYYQVTNDGNVTMRGALVIAFKTGLLPPSVQLSDNGNDLAFAIGGLAGPGAYGGYAFGAISNGSAVTPFGIAQSPGVSPLSWIDAAGVLHAPAPVTLAAGNQETGRAGLQVQATAAAQVWGVAVNFKTVLTNAPTSINLGVDSGGTANVALLTANNISPYGFWLTLQSGAAGQMFWRGIYQTVGNCLLAYDAVTGTFDHHCDGCGAVHREVPLARLTHQAGATPADSALAFVCPSCGRQEHFNCALSAADEADETPQVSGQYATTRGAQATLIRQLMTALGLELAP